MSGVETITLGCRLNFAESEAMQALAAGAGDLVIVNSCAVTAEAVRQTRKAIRQAARRRPEARILVTGCASTIDPAGFAAMAEVAGIIDNAAKQAPASFTPFLPPQRPAPRPTRTRSRAFVGVQNGCDHRCTFCIIPHGRGPSRSVPAGAVIEQIRALVDQGCNEVVLTGVDTTSYGPDLPGGQTLGHLVERVLTLVPSLPRLRLSSLDSVEIDARLFDLLVGEPRLQPHLHLSLQSGDDMILKRMKRRHSRAQAVAMVERLKAARPEIAIGADLIAGFPTESEAMALNTLALLDDCDIVFGHIFPFSPREGTPAARMPQLDPALVRARAERLRRAAEARRARWLATLVGTEQSVLVERPGTQGHAGNFATIRLATPAAAVGALTNGPRVGDIVAVRVTHVDNGLPVGEMM